MIRPLRALVSVCFALCASLALAGEPTLLYSVTGYEALSSKRALLRVESADEIAPDTRWQLKDAQGRIVQSGPLKPLPKTWGLTLWEADFSAQQAPGRYQLSILPGASGKGDTLESAAFDIGHGLLSRKLFKALSLHNAELRAASAAQGGGFYDCNSLMGEARSHGAFVAGLVDAFERRRDALNTDEQQRYTRQIVNGVRYLLALQRGDGSFANNHPARHGREDASSTPLALYGLAKALAVFKAPEDLGQRTQLLAAVRQGRDHLAQQGGRPNQAHLQAVLAMLLYQHGGDAEEAGRATQLIAQDLARFDLDTRAGYANEIVAPYFEALALWLQAFPERPERAGFIARAREIATRQYLPVIERNAFRLFPAGEPRSWREALRDPAALPKGAGNAGFWASGKIARMASDAVLLAEITGDERLIDIASAALGWITGLNSGVPSRQTSQRPLGLWRNGPVAAAYIAHIPENHALPWQKWWWPGDRHKVVSVINGATVTPEAGWQYSAERFEPSETFIWGDGLLLSAMVRYEDQLARKQAAP